MLPRTARQPEKSAPAGDRCCRDYCARRRVLDLTGSLQDNAPLLLPVRFWPTRRFRFGNAHRRRRASAANPAETARLLHPAGGFLVDEPRNHNDRLPTLAWISLPPRIGAALHHRGPVARARKRNGSDNRQLRDRIEAPLQNARLLHLFCLAQLERWRGCSALSRNWVRSRAQRGTLGLLHLSGLPFAKRCRNSNAGARQPADRPRPSSHVALPVLDRVSAQSRAHRAE